MNEKPSQDELIQKLKDQLKEMEATLSLIGRENWITRARRAEKWASETQDINQDLRRDNFDLRRENKRLTEMLETFEQYLGIKPIAPPYDYDFNEHKYDDGY